MLNVNNNIFATVYFILVLLIPGSNKKDRLVDLQRQLNILNAQSIDNVSTGSSGISAKDIVKADIDNIVASECLYCGEIMIRNIDKPFIDDNNYEEIMKEWE